MVFVYLTIFKIMHDEVIFPFFHYPLHNVGSCQFGEKNAFTFWKDILHGVFFCEQKVFALD